MDISKRTTGKYEEHILGEKFCKHISFLKSGGHLTQFANRHFGIKRSELTNINSKIFNCVHCHCHGNESGPTQIGYFGSGCNESMKVS